MSKQGVRFIKLSFVLLVSIYTMGCKFDKKKELVEINSTKSLFEVMKAKNDKKWFKNFTFKQLTLRYDESGKMIDSAMWYESVGYPLHFRIDRDIDAKNYVIYRNDSTYNFRSDTLSQAIDRPAVHLLFKGGLYFMTLEESLEKLKKYNYKAEYFRKDTFNSEPAFVVGDSDNQFWLHAEHFYCMRRIYTSNNGKLVDVVYDDFKRLEGGWVEQKVTFYVDGKVRLEEFYQDIKYRDYFDPKIYDPTIKYEWYLEY